MGHKANAAANLPQIARSKKNHATPRGTCQSGNDAKQRRLAGSVLAQQSVQTSPFQSCVYIMEGCEASEKLAYAFENDCRLRMGMIFGMDSRITQASVGTLRGGLCLGLGHRAGLIGSGRVLRRTLCLNLLSVKHAIVAVGTFDQRLGIVLERVGGRLGAAVGYLQFQPLLVDLEVGPGTLTVNAAWHDLSGDAQALAVCLVAHPLQFLDRDVIALGLLNTGKCKIRKRADDHGNRDSKTKISSCRRHELKSIPAAWTGQEIRTASLFGWDRRTVH